MTKVVGTLRRTDIRGATCKLELKTSFNKLPEPNFTECHAMPAPQVGRWVLHFAWSHTHVFHLHGHVSATHHKPTLSFSLTIFSLFAKYDISLSLYISYITLALYDI